MTSSRRTFLVICLGVALLMALPGLWHRFYVETHHRTVSLVMEYRSILSLSREAGVPVESLTKRLKPLGVTAITVDELTGEDLVSGGLPLRLLPASDLSLPPSLQKRLPPDAAVLVASVTEPVTREVLPYLRSKMPGLSSINIGRSLLLVLPISFEQVEKAGLIPDFDALHLAQREKLRVVFRPAPCPGVDGMSVANALKELKSVYPGISCIAPAGVVLAGYPDYEPIVATMQEEHLPVAQIEFVKQIGIQPFLKAALPQILPLHSIVPDEVVSRNLTRDQILDRMVRAVHERSVRLILVRPYDLYSGERLPAFMSDLEWLHASLQARGYRFGWPQSLPLWGVSLPSALSFGFALVFFMVALVWQWKGLLSRPLSTREMGIWIGLAFIVGISAWKIHLVGRLGGGFLGAFAATSAVLFALERWQTPFKGLLGGLGLMLTGGLCIASFYGHTSYMLRVETFSGVKLILLLPLLFVLFYDLKKRIHPESFLEILKRPPLWGELLLAGLLLAGLLLLVVRSDNVSFVPEWEIRFRDLLERLLLVRPRTKEFLIGYPSLILWYLTARHKWALRYREVFRLGAVLAFTSAVDSFCHLHTFLFLSIIRVLNGCWTGLLVGMLLVIAIGIVRPFWRQWVRVFFD